MLRSNLILLAFMSAGLTILVSLGTWQVNRLHWKEALIARVETYLAQPPRPVDEILAGSKVSELDYRPTQLSGIYLPQQTFFEFTTFEGESGWNLFAVFDRGDATTNTAQRYVIINRGFIPYDQKANWQEIAPLPVGQQQITGLLRVPPVTKPGYFLPDNDPAKQLYYWRDIGSMRLNAGLPVKADTAWYVDAGIPGKANTGVARYPREATTIISFSNNHLQYAATWYGLALALLGVGSYFLYARLGSSNVKKYDH